MKKKIFPFLILAININSFSQWNPNGLTVAGGNGIGSNGNQLNLPVEIFVTDNGTMYISDNTNNRIQIVTASSSPNAINTISFVNSPSGLFVDNDTVYVVEMAGNKVTKWVPPNYSIGTVVAGNGTAGAGNNQLNLPGGIWVDSSKNIYVTDWYNNRVMKWAPGDTSGTMAVNSIAGIGNALNQFNHPRFVWGDGNGNLYINDANNNRVMKWPIGGSIGVIVVNPSVFNSGGYPTGIRVDSANLYVTDGGKNRVLKFPHPFPSGGYSNGIPIVGVSTIYGSSSSQLKNPYGIAFDNGMNLYVADYENYRVQKFAHSNINIPPTGSALNFDGVNDYATGQDYMFLPSTDFTIEMWVKTDIATNHSSIISNRTGNNPDLNSAWYALGINLFNSGSYHYEFLSGTGQGCNAPNNLIYMTGASTVDLNWHHVAFTRQSNSLKLYVDGNLDATASQLDSNLNLSCMTNQFILGGGPLGSSHWFKGSLDEVRVWSIARTQTQIQTYMNCEIASSDSGLIANYHFNQGIAGSSNQSETLVYDASGESHTLSLLNFTLNGLTSNWITPGGVTNNSSCTRILNLKLFIQGYYANLGTMLPVLMNQGVGGNTFMTDSITVQLRNQFSPYNIITSFKTILNIDGAISCLLPPTIAGSYYVAVGHRNAIETWSANPISMDSSIIHYDFTTSPSKAYGNNMVEVQAGKWAFYNGDINQDENADLLDLSLLENDINLFQFGYFNTDLNGDGNVDLLDSPILEANINNFIFSNHP